jgi:hypothetical protein
MQTFTTARTQKSFDLFAPMDWRIIPDDEQLAWYVPQKMTQERYYVHSLEGCFSQLCIQSTFPGNTTDG